MRNPAGLFFCRAGRHDPAMRAIMLVLPLILVNACTRQASESAPAAEGPRDVVAAAPAPTATAKPAPAPSSTLATVDTLAGEWRVAGIDGTELNEPYGLALSGDETSLWWAPRCAGQERRYTIQGRAIRFTPLVDKPGTPPCLPGLPARLADVLRVLGAATTIGRTPSNGIEISGGGHSLLLFSQ
jgi:hypothetical protein